MKIPGAKWKKVSFERAGEKYDIEKASKGDISLDDLFGEEPEHFYVHAGSLEIGDKLSLASSPAKPERTVYVIEGDLDVNGPFLFENLDVYTTLWVTGSVHASRMALTWDACLVVGKTLAIDDVLFTYLTDAGNVIVGKGIEARLWLEGGDRGLFVGKASKTTKKLFKSRVDETKDTLSPALLPAFLDEGRLDPDKVKKAILAGKPLTKS